MEHRELKRGDVFDLKEGMNVYANIESKFIYSKSYKIMKFELQNTIKIYLVKAILNGST